MKTATFLLITAVLAAAFPTAALPQAPTQKTPAPAGPQVQTGANSNEENVQYGSQNGTALLLDIYKPSLPAAQPRRAVILIHGGGWTSYDKSTMRGMGAFLARSGFVAFAVDYRLFHGTENRWPAQLDDVQRAVRWIRANAAKYDVNPDRMGAFGHSAGAQLAALLGLEDTRENSVPELAKFSSRVQAVVDVSGPTDFTTARDAESLGFLAEFLGGKLDQHPDIWRDASPAYHVTKDAAPFLIVHRTRDENVKLEQAQELYEKLKAVGVSVSFEEVDDGILFKIPRYGTNSRSIRVSSSIGNWVQRPERLLQARKITCTRA